MLTITLPPDIEEVVSEHAEKQGTSPELYLLGELRQRYLPELPAQELPQDGETMADFFKGYAGTIRSSEFVPGGANLSQDTGKKFAQLMVEKRNKGKL